MRSFNNNRERRSDRPQMHTAVCDDCGKECKVPFKPSGDKPIYCSDCFEKRGNGAPRRDSNRSYGRDERRSNNSGLEQINDKLDRIIRLLEDREF